MYPAGRPASTRNWHRRAAVTGVEVAGFSTTLFPAANAGPTLCATVLSGELNGVMAQTTPTGTRIVKPMRLVTPGAPSSGTISPRIRLASSAESVNVSVARLTSLAASEIVKPLSETMVLIRSSSLRLLHELGRALENGVALVRRHGTRRKGVRRRANRVRDILASRRSATSAIRLAR